MTRKTYWTVAAAAIVLLGAGAAGAATCGDYLSAFHKWQKYQGEKTRAETQLSIAQRGLENATPVNKADWASRVASHKHESQVAGKHMDEAAQEMRVISAALTKQGIHAGDCPGMPKQHPHLP